MGALLFFVDGVGVGRDEPASNPFAAIRARRLAPLAGRPVEAGAAFRPLDARLGVPGLPQSATGQATLLTGVNAARRLGRHQAALPGPSLNSIIETDSLFLKLVDAGCRPTFANAYLRTPEDAPRRRWSVTTRAVHASGVPFRTLEDDEPRGEALGHDYTGEWFHHRGLPATPRDAAGAAAVLSTLLEGHDLVLYEYFLTDLAGHRGSGPEQIEQARRVEDLVEALLSRLDLARHGVIVVSDHGNLEESDHDRHTMNPAPFLAWGRRAAELVERVAEMEALTPALVEDLSCSHA